jgi:hypothetical protein
MFRSSLLVLVLALAASAASSASAGIAVGQSFVGEATYYGQGNDNRGACGGNGKPTGPGGITTVAINSQQWEGGANCGFCLEGRGTGVGAGATPVGKFFVAVNNLCPECKYGDIDFALNGDGRWKVEWKRVDCASKSGRKLLQANLDTMAFIDMIKGGNSTSSDSSSAASSPSSGIQNVVGAFAPAAAKAIENVPSGTVTKVKDAAASAAGSFLASKGSRKLMESSSSSSSSDFSLSSVAELASSPSSAGFESVLGAFAPAAQILAPTVQKVADSLSEETVSKVKDAASSVASSISKSLNSRKLLVVEGTE